MKITTLEHIPMPEITRCFNEGFSDYFVKFDASEKYLTHRWKGSAVDFKYSAGGWLNGKLVALLVTGVDIWKGKKTAYNAGTCVAPHARGNKFTERAYQFLLPKFKSLGIQQCLLEAIQKNERAIHVYKKIGFQITRGLECFNGIVEYHNDQLPIHKEFRELQLQKAKDLEKFAGYYPPWEHTLPSIIRNMDDYDFVGMFIENVWVGYAIVERQNGHIRQFAILPAKRRKGYGKVFFDYLGKKYKTLKLNNVDDTDEGVIEFLKKMGLKIPINQFEMLMKI